MYPTMLFEYPRLALIGALALMTISTLIGLYLTYYVIKCGVRDGIRESGLVAAARHRALSAPVEERGTALPDMRAD